MKRILGLDLGTGSIGWAVVDQAETADEHSQIIKLGVRVVPLTVDEENNFEAGKTITTTADRTLKRGMRRSLQRYKQRRKALISILKREHFITNDALLSEDGPRTTFETYRLRAKAVTEEISLHELARVLFMINKKRGYKSNRKANKQEDGQLIDGMDIARKLYDEHLTPGQYTYQLLRSKNGKTKIPSFYRSDLVAEFNAIWECQAEFYPDVLTEELRNKVMGRGKRDTSNIFFAAKGVSTAENKDRKTRLISSYRWRAEALNGKMDIEAVAAALCDINGEIAGSSGYLGSISDHSKELYFQHLTVGEYLMKQLAADPHYRVKNRVFFRQDYLHEFNTIWETQAKFHPELTDELKHEIRDVVIFYQRRLKSQKSLINFCEFEGKQITLVDGKKVMTGPRVCPKSSPIFQEFKIWQELNNVIIENRTVKVSKAKKPTTPTLFSIPEVEKYVPLTDEQRKLLHDELSVNKELSKTAILKVLGLNEKQYNINFKSLHGNVTQVALMDAYKNILEWSGHDASKFDKLTYAQKMEFVTSVFEVLGAKTDFLEFDASDLTNYTQQPAYKLWHLLYSFEEDNSTSGYDKLTQHIQELTGLDREYAVAIAAVSFTDDYGSLSTKAMCKILPHLLRGLQYDKACEQAGYRHSAKSLTREEIDSKPLIAKLEILPKNSLRNPVVEKILNQMIHVVNTATQEYGIQGKDGKHFDEIHIEMARELKQSQSQREDAYKAIGARTKENEEIIKILTNEFDEFRSQRPSRNDILRYRLYQELAMNGYKTLYSNTLISKEKLFSKDFEIEHIIPQALKFDDSYSNKTLETHHVNQAKGNKTAIEYVRDTQGEEGVQQYLERIAYLNKPGTVGKYKNLRTERDKIENTFLNRDLTDTQYIARKAREILLQATRTVVTTTGTITARLREDWQLIDTMKELNFPKFEKLGMTECYRNRDGHEVRRINNWSKRNDHRHHAMDALTVAFTRLEHVNYLNNLSSHADQPMMQANAFALRQNLISERKFIPPMPLDTFRATAMQHLSNILISIKAKNKVVTPHVNRPRGSNKTQTCLTPRAQLHKETIYGTQMRYVTKEEKVNATFTIDKIATVATKVYREALMKRLAEHNGDAKKAFTGKNALSKVPLYIDDLHTRKVPEKVKTVTQERIFTIRKSIDKDLKLDKVVDKGIRAILQQRLDEFDGKADKAFTNLDENPIWLNKEKGIAIKTVTITGVNNATPIHDKKDKDGNPILTTDEETIPVDYVSLGNNHHVAIYEDEQGDWHEYVMSYFEATERARQHLPIVDRSYNRDEGWKFLFTMKQNEYFVFPDPERGFYPGEIDLMDENNYALIAPHLFRVQKITTRDYVFRQQYETTVANKDLKLKGTIFHRILSENGLKGIVKVRINHCGKIVHVGEYQ